jgi:hypothetical protein
MKRVIYQVIAYVVDANGTFNNLSGYPKNFDSKNYDNDTDKTYRRANGDYCDAVGAMSKVDTRQLQVAKLMRVNDGMTLALNKIGELADLPDPEPGEETEPEQTT